jgi:hypothetical protein
MSPVFSIFYAMALNDSSGSGLSGQFDRGFDGCNLKDAIA